MYRNCLHVFVYSHLSIVWSVIVLYSLWYMLFYIGHPSLQHSSSVNYFKEFSLSPNASGIIFSPSHHVPLSGHERRRRRRIDNQDCDKASRACLVGGPCLSKCHGGSSFITLTQRGVLLSLIKTKSETGRLIIIGANLACSVPSCIQLIWSPINICSSHRQSAMRHPWDLRSQLGTDCFCCSIPACYPPISFF